MKCVDMQVEPEGQAGDAHPSVPRGQGGHGPGASEGAHPGEQLRRREHQRLGPASPAAAACAERHPGWQVSHFIP